MSAVSPAWMPASDASIPWVVPLFRAIQSGKMPRAFKPRTRKSASPTVERPEAPLISPTSVSRPAHFGMNGLMAMLAKRFRSSGWWEASTAIEVIPASNMVGISTFAAARSLSFLIP